MKTIYKYNFSIRGEWMVNMPEDAIVMHVGSQSDGDITLWALVDPNNENTPRYFDVVPTGGEAPEDLSDYLGTVMQCNGALVWHIFERGI